MPLDFDLDRELEGRGGVRGGQGDFKWTDVVTDKHRENYLGHSVMAPAGRWQKNKDVTWYNKDKAGAEDERRKEIKRIKRAEEDALSLALGFPPTVRPVGDSDSDSDGGKTAAQTGDAGKESKEERQTRRAERKARKEERRLAREARDERRRQRHHDNRDVPRRRDRNERDRDDDDRPRARSRSHSPLPRRRSRSTDRGRRPRSPDSRDRRH